MEARRRTLCAPFGRGSATFSDPRLVSEPRPKGAASACTVLLLLLAGNAALGQDFSNVKVERVSGGHAFTEGPAWSHDNYLVFSDIPKNKILKLVIGTGTSVLREESNGANGNTFDVQGRLYSCESHTRRVVRQDKKGKVEVLADKWQGKRLNAPNDIVVRKDGEVYFTDPAFGNQEDTRELDFFGVYHVSRKGELELVAKPRGRPNGVALSPNGRILYVANSDDHTVSAYDLDKNGAASNERVIISKIEGVPDGMRVDDRGNLYVAAKGLFVYSAEGKQLAYVQVPETPSNCAFGDADLQTLYITARTSVYRIRVNVKGSLQY
jgi:gluconolactonase